MPRGAALRRAAVFLVSLPRDATFTVYCGTKQTAGRQSVGANCGGRAPPGLRRRPQSGVSAKTRGTRLSSPQPGPCQRCRQGPWAPVLLVPMRVAPASGSRLRPRARADPAPPGTGWRAWRTGSECRRERRAGPHGASLRGHGPQPALRRLQNRSRGPALPGHVTSQTRASSGRGLAGHPTASPPQTPGTAFGGRLGGARPGGTASVTQGSREASPAQQVLRKMLFPTPRLSRRPAPRCPPAPRLPSQPSRPSLCMCFRPHPRDSPVQEQGCLAASPLPGG